MRLLESLLVIPLPSGRALPVDDGWPRPRDRSASRAIMENAHRPLEILQEIIELAEFSGIDYGRVHTGRQSVATQPPLDAVPFAFQEERELLEHERWVAQCALALVRALHQAIPRGAGAGSSRWRTVPRLSWLERLERT